MKRSTASRASDNAGGIRAKIERTRRAIEREIAKGDFMSCHASGTAALLDPDFDSLPDDLSII